MYKILFLGFSLISIIYGTIQVKFSKLSLPGHQSENKTWIYRGGYPENTIAGITQSLNQDYRGVQIDVFFDPQKNIFSVSSDDPSSKNINVVLTLENFLKNFSNSKHHWWLSLKNLNEENLQQVIIKINQLVETYDLTNRYFIESDQYIPLRELADASIPSLYKINLYTGSSFLFLRKIENKIKLLFSNFIGISIDYSKYGKEEKGYLSHLSKFLLTNQNDDKDAILSDPTVQVILVGPTLKNE